MQICQMKHLQSREVATGSRTHEKFRPHRHAQRSTVGTNLPAHVTLTVGLKACAGLWSSPFLRQRGVKTNKNVREK